MTLPKLTRAEWAQARQALDRLADLPETKRQTRLRDMDLAPKVLNCIRGMLSSGTRTGILDAPVAGRTASRPRPAAPTSLSPGTLVGVFRIDRLIAHGGMGELYLAHRNEADFEQRVALKLLRPEAAKQFDLFTAERQMLAGLEHPGIARLIDGGIASDGRPYMAIEYVEGDILTAWCADHRADLATRLGLFLSLCDAVGYAHARLVVHRDIKPANVLIDRDGRARLLDFGIARLVDAATSDRATSQAMATPHYAAPEQFDGSPITVATDIYALGAVLFELLAGRGPWTFDDAPLPVYLRRLLHDAPPLPSRVADGNSVPASRLIGDLDAIVVKAMHRVPEDRYSSVEAMADDVRRHLAFRPVSARTGSRRYRVLRYLRRNRWGVAAGAAIAAALLAGGAGVAWQARKAADQRTLARAEAERLEGVNQAMMLMFRDTSGSAQLGSITVRQMIDDTTRRLAGSLSTGARGGAASVAALADLYQIVENKTDAKRLLTTALARGVGRGDPAGSARLKLKLATILVEERQFERAQHLLDEAEAFWHADPILFRRERVETVGTLAYMRRLQGRRAEGIALLIANMPDAERAYADYSRDLATRYANLVTHLTEANRLAEADAAIRRGRSTLSRAGEGNSTGALTMLRIQASISSRRGDDRAAEAMLRTVIAQRRAFYGRSVALAVDLLHHARVLTLLGRPRSALIELDEAEPMSVELVGINTQPTLMMRLARIDALIEVGHLDAAQDVLTDVARSRSNDKQPDTLLGASLVARSSLAFARGDIAGASSALIEAETVFRTIGPGAGTFARGVATLRARIEKVRKAGPR